MTNRPLIAVVEGEAEVLRDALKTGFALIHREELAPVGPKIPEQLPYFDASKERERYLEREKKKRELAEQAEMLGAKIEP